MAIPAGVGYLAGGLASGIGSAFGDQPEEAKGNLHLVNPAQMALYNAAARGLLQGAGDFGYGSNIKQGKSQLQDFMASRGVKMSPQSGAYGAAYGSMVGNALGMDAQARQNYGLGLLNSGLQVAHATGANFIPGSPSIGYNQRLQGNSFFSATGGRSQLRGYNPRDWLQG